MHSENICSPCLGPAEEYIKKEEDLKKDIISISVLSKTRHKWIKPPWQSTHFFKEKSLQENEPEKPQNLQKMLRKSPASNAWAAILKNVDF